MRPARLFLAVPLLAAAAAGCSIPGWVPVVGREKAEPNLPPIVAKSEVPKVAPLLPGGPRERPAPSDEVVDRVVCVVNNDAITENDIDEAEAYYYYESKQPPSEGEARQKLRNDLLQRLIDNRLQLQQAEREKVVVEDAEITEQLAEVMKKLGVKNDAELQAALKAQGVTLESVKARVRESLMVQKAVRRKVALRVSVTEQEIDRYLEQNREKLETGLHFEARHILFLPEAGQGEDGWEKARRRAEDVYATVLTGADFGELARKFSDDGSGKDGGLLGPLTRGELEPDIEAAILKLRPGETSPPFRSKVGYHLFKLESRESLSGEGLAQARNQIREILYREKYQARFKEWMDELKQRAMIDRRL